MGLIKIYICHNVKKLKMKWFKGNQQNIKMSTSTINWCSDCDSSFKDSRGLFKEDFKKKFFKNKNFVFGCTSVSRKNVLRGLHLQTKKKQAK